MIEMVNGKLYIDGQYVHYIKNGPAQTINFKSDHMGLWNTALELQRKDEEFRKELESKLEHEAKEVLRKAVFNSLNPNTFGDEVEKWLQQTLKKNEP
jgi:hypothetical protein